MTEPSKDLLLRLQAVFVAEAENVQRYGYFAQVAEIEGNLDAARVFTELAESVACVAHGHFDFLRYTTDPATDQPLGETRLNLAAAVARELGEAARVYPDLAGEAHAEGVADVASWLETLCALKKAHVARLDRVLADCASRDGGADE